MSIRAWSRSRNHPDSAQQNAISTRACSRSRDHPDSIQLIFCTLHSACSAAPGLAPAPLESVRRESGGERQNVRGDRSTIARCGRRCTWTCGTRSRAARNSARDTQPRGQAGGTARAAPGVHSSSSDSTRSSRRLRGTSGAATSPVASASSSISARWRGDSSVGTSIWMWTR